MRRLFASAAAEVPKPLANRDFTYFDNFECTEDGIAIIRLNGPNKMNTISIGMQAEAQEIFTKHVQGNDKVKGDERGDEKGEDEKGEDDDEPPLMRRKGLALLLPL